MTHGDAASCKCPACKNMILHPMGTLIGLSTILESDFNCPFCHCALHGWARRSITVELEKVSKVK